jgi:hypothetical protein
VYVSCIYDYEFCPKKFIIYAAGKPLITRRAGQNVRQYCIHVGYIILKHNKVLVRNFAVLSLFSHICRVTFEECVIWRGEIFSCLLLGVLFCVISHCVVIASTLRSSSNLWIIHTKLALHSSIFTFQSPLAEEVHSLNFIQRILPA